MDERKKMLLIINPKSGKGQIKNQLLNILDIFIKAGYRTEVHVTQQPSEAREVAAREGQDKDLVVCSGGDGTLNEVVSGLMELKVRPNLGYIPAGSTNDYGASLKIPKQMSAAARLALWMWGGFAAGGILCMWQGSAPLLRFLTLHPRIRKICWGTRHICWKG